MQDIDFDELDRAVSSVLGTTPKQAVPQPSPVVAEATPTPLQPQSNASQPSAPVQPSAPRPQQPVSAAPRPATGRFMDVVHPSSDMRGASAPTQPAISPLDITPNVTSVAPQTVYEEPAATLEVPSAPDIAEISLEETAIAPLESPFLTDAKVEKRPLGAFSDEHSVVDAPTPAFDESLEMSEEVLIGAIESADTNPETLIEEVSEAPVVGETVAVPEPAVEVAGVQEVQPAPVVEDTPAAPEFSQSIQPTITSIPQQYTEQVATTQAESGAIFDTESYHQPLAHPQKKKSGVLVIVWIVGLIVLGAALGAALYFFVLQGM